MTTVPLGWRYRQLTGVPSVSRSITSENGALLLSRNDLCRKPTVLKNLRSLNSI